MDYEYGPEEFEKRFGIAKASYEGSSSSLLVPKPRGRSTRPRRNVAPSPLRGSVKDVKLVGEGAAVELVLLFRIARESALCGVRYRIWPAGNPTRDMIRPDMTAKLWIWNVVEIFESTPTSNLTVGADTQGIVWWIDL